MRLLKLDGQVVNLDLVARYLDVPGRPDRLELEMSFGGSVILEGEEAAAMRRFLDYNSHPCDRVGGAPTPGPEDEDEGADEDESGPGDPGVRADDLYHSARGSQVLPPSRPGQTGG